MCTATQGHELQGASNPPAVVINLGIVLMRLETHVAY